MDMESKVNIVHNKGFSFYYHQCIWSLTFSNLVAPKGAIFFVVLNRDL